MAEVDTNISATALKAFSVLDFVGEQRHPVTAAGVAAGLDIDRATAYRMLMTLVQAGYVRRTDDGGFGLSFRLLTLTRHLVSEDERTACILEHLRTISEKTGETVHYSMLDGDSAVLVLRAKGSQRVAVDFQIGDRSPLHCTSIGKVLLAYNDARLTGRIIAAGLPKSASNTITDGEALHHELARVRAQRYAYDDREFADDMRCLAVPVFEKHGEVPGGIAISGPASRFDDKKLDELRHVALRYALELSRALGGYVFDTDDEEI